ncbi:MAG: HAD-IA family hydrolase [Candidatus Micrarchaeota archaeon]|nr:HAD-IA family hydrolase [Candidatus Micrarchaeota archaeon]
MAFSFRVEVKDKGSTIASRTIRLSSKKNLMAAIRREFSDFKFVLDKKYGAEVSQIAGLKKSKQAGLHFTIDGKVPWIIDAKTGKKLYLSLYHITATESALSGRKIVLELVCATCDFPDSLVDARLELRTEHFMLESLVGSESYLLRHRLPPYARQASGLPPLLVLCLLRRCSKFGAFPAESKKGKEGFPVNFPLPERHLPAIQQQSVAEPQAPSHAELPMPIFEGLVAQGPVAAQEHEPQKASLCSQSRPPCLQASAFFEHKKPAGSAQAPAKAENAQKGNSAKAASQQSAQTAAQPPNRKSPWKAKKPPSLSAVESFKAAIFDLDGVVVDSERAHLSTFNQALSRHKIRILPSFWKRNYTGIGSVAIVRDLKQRYSLKESVQSLVKRRSKIYGEYVQRHGLPPISGFMKVRRFLEQNGVKIAVASGGHRKHIAASLGFLKMGNTPFVGLEDVKRAKPAPDVFLLAAQRLGVKPSECVVFEDSLAGIEAARRAGMACIALSTTLPAKLVARKAAAVFRDYRSKKLMRLLSRLVKKSQGKKPASSLRAKAGAKKSWPKKARRQKAIRKSRCEQPAARLLSLRR